MAPVRQPCTRLGGRLAIVLDFAKDLPSDASVVTIVTIVCHLCDEEFALAAGFCDVHHNCRNMVAQYTPPCIPWTTLPQVNDHGR
jgi:hypothetical protein